MLLSYLRNYILPSITGRGMGVGLLLCALCASCDHIDDDERLIYVKPVDIGRCVLIEDFTGQRCVNCPTATQVIADLQEAYGEDHVVAVAIHSGPFAKSVRGVPYPLMTEVGDAYYNHWGFDHQPVGIVNRQFLGDYAEWGTQVYGQLQRTARVGLSLVSDYDDEKRTVAIDVKSLGIEGVESAKLQVWLTEDNINAFQYMPDGSSNREYIHNHVFRDAVNGEWGTDFRLSEGEEREETFSYTFPENAEWVPEHMHVVAFVYTDKGVEQVISTSLVSPQSEDPQL